MSFNIQYEGHFYLKYRINNNQKRRMNAHPFVVNHKISVNNSRFYLSARRRISPKTPLAVTEAPAPAP